MHIADAEATIDVAEAFLTARLQACTDFINQRINPLIRTNKLIAYAEKLEGTFAAATNFAKDIDDVTLKIMGKILKFYGILYKKYPLLIKILEKESWSKETRRRLFE